MTHPPRESEALSLGDAVHVAVLEPARFEREYVRAPKFNNRSNAGKMEAAEWREKHPDVAALTSNEWEQAVAIKDAVWANECAVELLGRAGQNEMTVIWIDEKTGLLCKARIDRFTDYHGWTTCVDLKTALDASPRGFAQAVVKYLYHQQAAWYLDGLNTLAPHNRRFVFLSVEKEPPYCVAPYELDDSAIDEGRAQYRRALDTYAACNKEGKWPGYDCGINTLELPKYAYELTQAPV
jgi:hypothetical protein